MRGLISLLIVAAIAFGVYQFYLAPHGRSESTGNMVQAISTTGVKNDLLAIAQAERGYFAEHGKYATLDELTSSGALAASGRTRPGYTYSVEITPGGFLAMARYSGPENATAPSFATDQSMEIRSLP
jgi:hypothetical protein